MLKLYLSSVIIYFLIFMSEGIIFKKEFNKAQEIINKHFGEEVKKVGYLKTTISYLLISFIPIIRLITFITKICMTIEPKKFIKLMEESKKNE